jgi:hypothetical protein
MQYQRAANLGMLHQQLGIPPNARMFFELVKNGIFIWNLDNGDTYTVVQVQDGSVQQSPGHRNIPEETKMIIGETDDLLKARWLSTMGWDEIRESVFSELSFRGINILKLEGIH